jgi:tRNA pseudouridine38-40 synthase
VPRIAVGIEYDGAGHAGWQAQRDAPGLQTTLEAGLARVADHPVSLVAAGRTDAGVHARCLVAHFDTPAHRPMRAWVLGANAHLPRTVALRWAMEVPDHFHARYSALARSYRYCLLVRAPRPALADGRVTHIHRPLDLEAMQAASRLLIGEHDFSAFRAAECQARSAVRRLEAVRWHQQGDLIVAEFTANAFLHHMVRNLMGLFIEVGQGKLPPAAAAELLAGRDRRAAPATAPACGLYLWRVHYPPVFGLPDDSAMIPGPAGCLADLMG